MEESKRIMFVLAKGAGDLDFVSWIREPDAEPRASDLADAYEQIAEYLKSCHAVPLHERIFGEVAAASAALEARQRAVDRHGLDPAPPPTYVEGRPCAGPGVAGIHLIAARSASAPASVVEWDGEPCGRLVEGTDARYLSLTDVARLVPHSSPLGPEEETREALDLVEELLRRHQWSFNDVYRTWFYLTDILDWYAEFNRVRNDAFERLGLFAQPLGVIPASTGIQGRGVRAGWCTLDLLATKPLDGHSFRVQRLTNPQQNEAPEYGSAFSRGLEIAVDRCRYLLVSGTASINDQGLSIHAGDFERQTEQTLDTVASLLGAGGATLGDICQATAFVKRAEDIPAYRRIIRRRGLEELPVVSTIGDVCRPELLFELDATAMLPTPARGHESGS